MRGALHIYRAALLAGCGWLASAVPAIAQVNTPAAGQADAQPDPSSSATQEGRVDNQAGLQDIVVTAQRRSENLQRVPIAVSVATGEQLGASGVTDVANLKIVTPGVEVQSNNGYALPVIRGVGSKGTGAGIETPIAIYIDDVYYAAASATLLSFNNISQIEVLKGPQGTLFGRNATGGLIQVRTKDPSPEFGGEVNVGYGNYQTFKADAYLTGGIGPDAAVDLAVTGTTMGDGYGTNLVSGRDVYKVNHDVAARNKWVFNPGDWKFRLILDYQNTKSSMIAQRLPIGATSVAPYGPFYGGSPWDTAVNYEPLLKLETGGASLRVDRDLGGVRLASITAYRKSNFQIMFDLDYTPTDGRGAVVKQIDNQFSQEFQILSAGDKRINWMLGAYYFNASSRYPFVDVFFNGVASLPTVPATVLATTKSEQKSESIAGFGQATIEVLPRLKATAGLRYTSEKRSLVNAGQINTLADGSTVIAIPFGDRDARFNKLTWRFALDYEFSNTVLGYASYNRGFKSGGFNPSALTLPAFEPEVLDAYEVGLKTSLLDRRVRFNVAGYYYDYKDIQVQRQISGATGIYNGAGAEIYGGEAELQARLTSELDIRLGYQFAHGKYTEFPNALIAEARPTGGYALVLGDVSGNRTVLTPRSTLSAVGNYSVPVGDGDLNFNLSYYYNSGFFHEPDNVIRQPSYSLLNASVRWKTSKGLSFTVWANNLTDEVVASLDGVNSLGTTANRRASYSPPRTYGVTAGITF